jgi:methyl-accepting chemotaxis protein
MNLNLTIGGRILTGYAFASLMTGALGFVTYRAVTELAASEGSVRQAHQVREMLADVMAHITDAETGQRGFLLTGEERYLRPYTAAITTMSAVMLDLRKAVSDEPFQLKRISALDALVADRLAELAESIAARRRDERDAVKTLVTDRGRLLMTDIRKAVSEMDVGESEILARREQHSQATVNFALGSTIVGGVVVLVLVTAVGLLIRRSITRPLLSCVQFADRVGRGDLTHHPNVIGTDELGALAQSLDGMVTGLIEVTGQTRMVTENLNSAAAEILASAQQQAAGAGEQAAAIQQTATTMEEVTQSGVQISDRAKLVAASAEATSTTGYAGLQAVESTARTMEAIQAQAEAVAENVIALSEKTQAVGEIISSVNDLAEQSHLLALNAAIEAAAAGEHGRTFSVIAGEVKNLADQSREATVHVRSILGDIQKRINSSVMLAEEAVKRVESGKEQADIADRTIRAMTENLQHSVQTHQQIVAGANQQQIGFGQVMQAIRDIGQTSQETASSTRQLERAALNLTMLAQQLQKAVERYRSQ